MRATWMLALALVACRSRATTASGAASIPIGAADGGPPAHAPPPSDVACTFEHANTSFEVSLTPKGPAYAMIDSVDDVLSIPTGDASRGARLVHSAYGIHIETFVEAERLDLHLKKAVAFGGWYFPYASSELRWTSGGEGRLALEPRVSETKTDSVQVAIFDPPRAVLPCDAVAVTVPEEFDVLTEDDAEESYVVAEEPIPLARAPGGSPVANIRFTYADEARVAVLERREASVRVAITEWSPATLIAWIPSSALVPPPVSSGGHRAHAPSLRMGKAVRRNIRTATCTTSVPLHAEAKGVRARIGEIGAGTTFTFYAGEGDEREVQLRGIRTLEDARLFVPSSVERCK